ncbi:MAG: hypothetical protein NVSMB55_24040 [Mycobacteriales bacterium]
MGRVSDTGGADPRLATALQRHDGAAAARAEVMAALAGARVFVAITATPTAVHLEAGTGLRAESSAEMALVSIVASDGQRALPAFADTATLMRWRLDVRPVPVTAPYLARAALEDGADAVLLDPTGAGIILRRRDLQALADGYVPVAGAPLAARTTDDQLTPPAEPPRPELVRALAAALRPERLRAARLLDGPHGPVLGISPRRPIDPAALTALAQRVMTRLGSALPTDGLDLAVVPQDGPGYPVITRPGR